MNPETSSSVNSLRDSSTTSLGPFPSIQAATIAAGMLEANSVPCSVSGQTIAAVIPMTDTWTPVYIIVPTALAARARDLLRSDANL